MYTTANKHKRRLLSAIIAIMMVLSLMTPAMVDADPTVGEKTQGSLNITKMDKPESEGGKKLPGAEFTLYKIMNLVPKSNPAAGYDYSIVSAYQTVLAGLTPDDLGNFSAAEIEAKVNDILMVNEPASAVQVTDASGVAKFNNLALGYYLVVETKAPNGYIAGKPFFVAIPSTDNYDQDNQNGTTWVYDVNVIPKNEELNIEKWIVSGGALLEEDTASVGDRINYVVESNIPDYDDAYFADNTKSPIFKISDEMDAGLTFTFPTDFEKAVRIDNGSEIILSGSSDYSLVTGTNGFALTFTRPFLKDHRGAKIKLYYSAVLNENAVKGTGNSNDNAVTLEYSNNPKDLSHTEKIDDETKVYTFGVKVEKFGEDNNPLSGAAFVLYSDEACTKPITGELVSDNNGMITFPNVKEGIYYLKETKSPKGYTLLTNPIKIEIKAIRVGGKLTGDFELYVDGTKIEKTGTPGDFTTKIDLVKGDSTIAVKNHEGFTLPETGGMGIYIFLAIGLIGIIAISIVMTRKKPSRKMSV